MSGEMYFTALFWFVVLSLLSTSPGVENVDAEMASPVRT